ncbi:glycoside hydrolase domain-containing protein [Pedobacter sp. UC225_65]|uniref:glycoside hydrolase domain-containing protein n=1 Tax=Pedobacter sp. UC225_65 TaxID=3350173 RepID=UPI00366ACE91
MIIVQDAKTGQKINHILPLSITKENGLICFEPESGTGQYYIYYQPYKNEGRSNYPKGVYPKQEKLTNWITKKRS